MILKCLKQVVLIVTTVLLSVQVVKIKKKNSCPGRGWSICGKKAEMEL